MKVDFKVVGVFPHGRRYELDNKVHKRPGMRYSHVQIHHIQQMGRQVQGLKVVEIQTCVQYSMSTADEEKEEECRRLGEMLAK